MKAPAPNHALEDGLGHGSTRATEHEWLQDRSAGGDVRSSRQGSRLWLPAMLGLGALSGAAAYGTYRRDLARIQRTVRSGSRIVATSCGPIEYAVQGQGLPVLAVHGAGGGYDQGLLVAGNAFREGYQVIAPSRFGYLRTPVPQDVSPAAQADAHAALLDALGIRQAVVVGVSAGTPSAVEFALRYPNRTLALVLLVPAGYAPGHKVGLEPSAASQIVARIIVAGADFALWTAMHVTRSKVVRFLGVPPEIELRASPAEREQVTAIMRSVLPVSWRAAGVRIDMSTSYEPRPLEQIRAPTLVVSTHDDLFGTLPVARYLAKRISHARLVVYDTGGHLLVGRQAELCEAGRAFLKETSLNLAGWGLPDGPKSEAMISYSEGPGVGKGNIVE